MMEPVVWAAVVSGLAIVLVALAIRRGWKREAARQRRRTIVAVDAAEIAEIAEMTSRLAAIVAEESSDHDRRMVALVQHLVDRRVPARAVEVAAGLAEVRIRFADGTAVLARGDTAGDLGILAAVIRERSATPSQCTLTADGAHVYFVWPGIHRRLSVRIIGVDQPS